MAKDGIVTSTEAPLKDAESGQLVLERRLLTPLLSKKVPPIPTDEERKFYPFKKANPISKVFFWWLNPIMNVGYKRTLTPQDLFKLTPDMTIDHTYEKFDRYLTKIVEKDRAAALKKDPSLTPEDLERREYPKFAIIKALFLTFKWEYSTAIMFKVFADVCGVCNPLLSKELIKFVSRKTLNADIAVNDGVGYAFGCTLLLAFSGIFINQFLHLSITTGAHCKGILTTALLKKSFRADAETRHKFTSGRITSLMSTDLARIDLAIGLQPFGWTFPIPVIIAIALLIVNIGVASLAGIAVFIISILVIGGSAKALLKMRRGANKFTDKRISLMREILQSMKMIKYYSWEDAYESSVVEQRNSEVGVILKMQSIRNFLLAFSISLPSFTSMIAFLVLYGISSNRNPANIFPSISLFGSLAQQTMMLPMALATGTDAMIGLNRVREFLQSGVDLEDPEAPQGNDQDTQDANVEKLPEDVALSVKNATFIWETFDDEEDEGDDKPKADTEKKDSDIATPATSTKDTHSDSELKNTASSTEEEGHESYTKSVFEGFHNINLDVKKGEFVIVTGAIGSGKSSLLIALAGFMKQTGGTLTAAEDVLLCGAPWVQNTTVRENITFGLPYEEERYERVIDACALRDDLKLFAGGDLTEIGERGITLSGGQKARINLARAVYADKNIVLFDDVLSAVDARVGKHIIDDCFGEYMKGKTRVLATHQLSLVDKADRVVFLNGDGTLHIGTVEELLTSNEGFIKLMEFSKKSSEEDEEEDGDIDEEEQEIIALQKSQSLAVIQSKKNNNDAAAGVLVNEEERAKNKISSKVYTEYLREGGGILGKFAAPIAILLLILDVFTTIFINVWLSFWITYKWKNRSDGFYIGFYVMFVVLNICFIASCFVLLGYISTTSARELNLKAMRRILHAPMAYLDVTPMGRILNRFTKDTDVLDNELGEQLRLFLHPTAFVIGVIILCIIYLPWFALVIPPLLVVFSCVTSYYQSSSREVKRLEAVQRSFVYNNFNEVLNGMSTLKAYRATSRFLKKNNVSVDRMNEAYFVVIANQRWISIHMDMVAVCLLFVVAMLAVTRQFSISAASAGLVVTYVMQIGGLMSLIMRAYTTVENEMNSVERLCQYANDLVQEKPYRINETKPSPSWPESGSIEFEGVSLRYRDGLPLVLRNLTLAVAGGEKIGICGRTGAGKSSIMTALYRLSELAEGRILIDGLDISKMGLFELRSKLSIIPQDPVLFQGTIRRNLDPFGESDDQHLWDSLRRAGLIDSSVLATIKAQGKEDKNFHKFHLDQAVEDDGSNFSLGERQLLALARALVRNSRILILDEATSSVDYETDAKIQSTIKSEFSECTILCIAHRLKTILDYDKILVLEAGEIEEFGTPMTLYENDGIFRQMCDRSDITREDFVHDL
ncbi:CYFA0S01e06238g1_1 [Cyberlindnera fabianii]|uniref:CYFA0S01e06238g1_1 n=1 Tax=Cyberlindnera fabianii TaxID=36022 RepID=A0A061AHF9_CYBFA|nr:CYFA0S01e06238g1_1 [Cyberlindnera fabianii]